MSGKAVPAAFGRDGTSGGRPAAGAPGGETLAEDGPHAAGAAAGSRKQRRLHLASRPLIIVYRVVSIALVLVAWQLMSGRVLPAFTVSRPTDVVSTLYHYLTSSAAAQDVPVTAEEYVIGLGLGVAGGLVAAVALGVVTVLGRIYEPVIAALNAVPLLALAPLFIVILGIGVASKIAIAAIAVFFIIFYNVYIGILNVPQTLVDTVKLLGGHRRAQLRYAIIPSLAPSLFAGLRLSAAIAMIGVLVGEFVAAPAGIGNYIDNETQLFQTAGTLAGLIVAVAIVLVFRLLVILAERRATRWQRARG